MLTLPIKKEWFGMIVSGVKEEEYREPGYWLPRLKREALRQFGPGKQGFDGVKVRIRNGYRAGAPEAELTLAYAVLSTGKAEWGAEQGVEYLVLGIKEVRELPPMREQMAERMREYDQKHCN